MEHRPPGEQVHYTKRERNVSAALALCMVAGGVFGAFSFFSGRPVFPLKTPAEMALAERWIDAFLAFLTIGFAFSAVLGMIAISALLGRIPPFRAKPDGD